MKAEHRKELETNALADRLGKMVTNIKHTGPQRGVALYVVLGILVAALVFFSVRWYRLTTNENSEAWLLVEVGEFKTLQDTYPETNAGRSWRFQLAWYTMWENGIKKLGADQRGAFDNLDKAANLYEQLLKEVEGDPFWEPEALYGLAQITETKTLLDPANLDRALEQYQDLAKKHPKAAFGQLAEKRVEVISDSAKRLDVVRVYQDLKTSMRIDRKPFDLNHP